MATWFVEETPTTRCVLYRNDQTGGRFVCNDVHLGTPDQEIVNWVLSPEANPAEGDIVMVGTIRFVIQCKGVA